MRQFLFTFTLMSAFVSNGQTWHSMHRLSDDTLEPENWTVPIKDLIVDPFTNNLWFISGDKVSVIENNGDRHLWEDGEGMGGMHASTFTHLAFTANHIYVAQGWDEAVYTFDNYNLAPIAVGLSDFTGMYHNPIGDTLYFSIDGGIADGMKKYTETGGTISTNWLTTEIAINGDWFYGFSYGDNSMYYYYNSGPLDFTYITIGAPEYLNGEITDVKFLPETDTVYVASKKGISLATAYNFFTNYSPSNTLNMPSENVVEIDFNPINNDLWAVFADDNDEEFAIAKLAYGDSVWTDIYDISNSPIQFWQYQNMAIDTLGNLYVCDHMYMHTLSSPNNPQWVKLDELSPSTIAVFPNPAKETVQISIQDNLPHTVALMDINGKRLSTHSQVLNTLTLDLSKLKPGVYFLQVDHQWMEKIMVE